MRILYGVQATGNGHISRARAMANAFRALNVEVTWLFSGRPREQLFDMAPFGDYLHRRGLTFVTEDGRIRYRRTLRNTNLLQFRTDVRPSRAQCRRCHYRHWQSIRLRKRHAHPFRPLASAQAHALLCPR